MRELIMPISQAEIFIKRQRFVSWYLFIAALILLSGIASAVGPAVTGINPVTSGTARSLSVNLSGTNFTQGASIMLTPVNVQPVHKGSIVDGAGGALLNRPDHVFVSGHYAYIASTGSHSLEIVDVSDPANPVHKGSIGAGSFPSGVFISGNYAYILSNNDYSAFKIVDVSDPANPYLKGSVANFDGGALLSSPTSIFVSGNYAYIASSPGLEILDVSNPSKPVHKGSITGTTGGALLNSPYGVYVSGDYAYLASFGNDALEIVDVSNPANPVHMGSIKNGDGFAHLDHPRSVYVSGNFAYVVSQGSNALEIVDVSDPAHPVHKGSIQSEAGGPRIKTPYSVYVSGNYAYIASIGSDSLEIVDISNPARPIHKGSVSDDSVQKGSGAKLDDPFSVFVSGTYAYVGNDRSNALEIIDIGTVTGTNVTVLSPEHITCMFDVGDKKSGTYHVVVTNPDGSFGVLANGFGVGTSPVPTTTQADLPAMVPFGAVICAVVIFWS